MSKGKVRKAEKILSELYHNEFFDEPKILAEISKECKRRNKNRRIANNDIKECLIGMEKDSILKKHENKDTCWIRKSKYDLPPEWINTTLKKVFISYVASTESVKRADAIKKSIEETKEYVCFFAKHSLQNKKDHLKSFANKIVGALEHADIFVAVYSDDYWKSEYCNQEVGFVLNPRQKVFVYFSLDPNNSKFEGKGFIQSYSIIKTNDNDIVKELNKMNGAHANLANVPTSTIKGIDDRAILAA